MTILGSAKQFVKNQSIAKDDNTINRKQESLIEEAPKKGIQWGMANANKNQKPPRGNRAHTPAFKLPQREKKVQKRAIDQSNYQPINSRRFEIAEKSKNEKKWDKYSNSRKPSNDDARSNKTHLSKKTYMSKDGKPVGSKFLQNAAERANQMRESLEKVKLEKKAQEDLEKFRKDKFHQKHLDKINKK